MFQRMKVPGSNSSREYSLPGTFIPMEGTFQETVPGNFAPFLLVTKTQYKNYKGMKNMHLSNHKFFVLVIQCCAV